MEEFPSGQREQTVNLPSTTSVVRIHPLPPRKTAKFSGFSAFSGHKNKPPKFHLWRLLSLSQSDKRPCKILKSSKQSAGQKPPKNAFDHLLTTYLTTYFLAFSKTAAKICFKNLWAKRRNGLTMRFFKIAKSKRNNFSTDRLVNFINAKS